METLTQFTPIQLEKAAALLKTVAHPLRISIVELLTYNEPLTVTEICATLNSEQSLTSHHLNTLRRGGVVESHRKSQFIYYSLKLKEITNIMNCIQSCKL